MPLLGGKGIEVVQMRVNHRWTEEERQIVRRDYRGNRESVRSLAERLDVSFFGVRGQIAKMGISFRPDRRSWTPEEDEQLRELITRHSPGAIAKRMHRSINSVVVRSTRLGLSRRVRDGWYTKLEVCEILGVDHHWVQNRIDSGALRASYHNGHRPRKNGGACWHIAQKSLRQFIRRYPQELKGRNVDIILIVDILAGLDSL